MSPRLSIVVPVWNQWECTRAFLESFEACVLPGSASLILVDNGSRDATAKGLKEFAARLPLKLIRNRKNLGCAPAWNQGVKAALKAGADWIGVLNNDLILSPGIFDRMLRAAQDNGLDIVSPATREGGLHYGLEERARLAARRGQDRVGEGWFGWFFLARTKVFESAGLFDEGFKLGIGEDEDFMRRAQKAGFVSGIAGNAFTHHFGSRTLGPLRKAKGKQFEERNLRRLRARWGFRPASLLSKWASGLRRGLERLRWGYGLKE